jgi:hypothetical protein
MGHWFDDLSRSKAVPTSRRRALKLFATGVGGALAASLGSMLGRADASADQSSPVNYPAGWNLVAGPSGSLLTGAIGSL